MDSRFFRNILIGLILSLLLSNLVYSQDLQALKLACIEAHDNQDLPRLDSLSSILVDLSKSASDGEMEAFGYLSKANASINSNPVDALLYSEKAAIYYERMGVDSMLRHLYNQKANIYATQGKSALAIENYQKSLSSINRMPYKSINDVKIESRITFNLATRYLRMGNLEKATSLYHTAQETIPITKDSALLCAIVHSLGTLSLENKDFENALGYYYESLELYSTVRPGSINYPLMSLGNAYLDIGKLDSSEHYYNRAILHDRKINNKKSLCSALSNITELYVKQNRIEEAKSAAIELKELAHELNAQQHKLNAQISLGSIYKKQNIPARAYEELQLGISYIDAGEMPLTVQLYKLLSEVSETLQKDDDALEYHKQYKIYSDSIVNEKSIESVERLKIKYETKEKEETIKHLELQSALDKNIFHQRVSYFVAGLTSLLLLGVVGLFYFNRKKLKLINQKNNIEQRLLRSQMNPHFIFNAISSIQNYLYDKNDLKVALTYMSKFAELMRQVLENSREESIPLTTEIKSLENYLELQQLRYNNSFGYEINIDPSIDANNILVPPLIAQPFVENAIEHGMIYRVENGKVQISVNSSDDQLTLVIQDNGVGFKAINIEPKKVFNKKTSLATKITKERLDLISKASKKKFDLIIDKLQAGGTIVTIQLPKVSAI